MRPRRGWALLGIACSAALAGGCKKKEQAKPAPAPADAEVPRAPVPDKIEGTLTLDGKPLPIERCRPGREESIYVDLVTARGALRFLAYESKAMFWNPRPESTERGAPMACTDLRRSWGGGTRPGGETYFRGQLIFTCRGAPGSLQGDVTVDCGNISPLERRLLDENRQRKLDELKNAGKP